MSDRPAAGGTSPSTVAAAFDAARYTMCVSGSYAPPGQFDPPLVAPREIVPIGPSALLTTGGVKMGPSLYRCAKAAPCALSSGVKSIRSSSVTPFLAYASGLLGVGCVGEYHSPGTSPFSTGFS